MIALSRILAAILGVLLLSVANGPGRQATQQYKGPPRLIVPTIRSTVMEGDKPPLRIIVLAGQPPQVARFPWRTMATGEYAVADFQHVARGIYTINLPPIFRGRHRILHRSDDWRRATSRVPAHRATTKSDRDVLVEPVANGGTQGTFITEVDVTVVLGDIIIRPPKTGIAKSLFTGMLLS